MCVCFRLCDIYVLIRSAYKLEQWAERRPNIIKEFKALLLLLMNNKKTRNNTITNLAAAETPNLYCSVAAGRC